MLLLARLIYHTSIQYMDFGEIFNVSLDLSTIYFGHFSGCSASFVYSCYSILECYNLFLLLHMTIETDISVGQLTRQL